MRFSPTIRHNHHLKQDSSVHFIKLNAIIHIIYALAIQYFK